MMMIEVTLLIEIYLDVVKIFIFIDFYRLVFNSSYHSYFDGNMNLLHDFVID